jgi:RNA polymerase sigma-70 factor, ECF subfamily
MSDCSRAKRTVQLTSLVDGNIDSDSLDTLFATCQQELRNAAMHLMRNERINHTLQPTALVNEVYLRLFDVDNLPIKGRAHFVNIAARSMRQIMVEHARRHNAVKRGGGLRAITLTDLPIPEFRDPLELLALHDALEKLALLDPRAVKIVEMRIFGGLTMEEIASVMAISRRTIQKDWRFALMWLRQELMVSKQ